MPQIEYAAGIPDAIPDAYPLNLPRGCICYLDMQSYTTPSDTTTKVFDRSGLGNQAAIAHPDATPSFASGPTGWVYSQNGTSVQNLSIISKTLWPENLTVICWVKNTGSDPSPSWSGIRTVFEAEFAGGYFLHSRWPAGQEKWTAGIRTGNNTLKTMDVAFSVIGANSGWHMWAITATGGNTYTYVDGVQRATTTYTAPRVSTTSNTLVIGCYTTTTQRLWAGNIGIFAVCSVALSQVELLSIYRMNAWRYELKA